MMRPKLAIIIVSSLQDHFIYGAFTMITDIMYEYSIQTTDDCNITRIKKFNSQSFIITLSHCNCIFEHDIPNFRCVYIPNLNYLKRYIEI